MNNMDKTYFAVLASAALAFPLVGAVLASDFTDLPETDTQVEDSAAEGAEIAINETNFPDPEFRKSISKNGSIQNASEVTAVAVPENAKSLEGIQYLRRAESFEMNGNAYISMTDLSANQSLRTITIQNNSSLQKVKLPDAEDLAALTIAGNRHLRSLDLTPAENLSAASVSDNDLEELNIEGLTALDTLDASRNRLYQLDASSNIFLNTLSVSGNKMYALNLPSHLTELQASNNKLQFLDLSSLKRLTSLDVSSNMLSRLILPTHTSAVFTKINFGNNHLAAISLKDVKWADTAFSEGGGSATSPQTLYYNQGEKSVNIRDYDEAFNTRDNLASTTSDTLKAKIDEKNDGVIVLNGETNPSYNIQANTVNASMTVTLKPAQRMNRLYNPNSGEHFYTRDIHEKDTLVRLGWKDEGIGWIAPADDDTANADAPVYRLYNPNAGDHHYTLSANERNTLIRLGWKDEGTGWYSAGNAPSETPGDRTETDRTVEVFRAYNPNAKGAGAHNYTISAVENHTLASLGWRDEGISWQALK